MVVREGVRRGGENVVGIQEIEFLLDKWWWRETVPSFVYFRRGFTVRRRYHGGAEWVRRSRTEVGQRICN